MTTNTSISSKTVLQCQKENFFLADDVTYLNGAYMAPSHKSVDAAGIKGIQSKRTPDQVSSNDFFESLGKLRIAYSELINNPEPNRIASIPAVSYGTAIVAKNIQIEKGENIVLIGEQFPSNVYVWRELAAKNGADILTVSAPDTKTNRGKIWNERLLETINSKTRLVAMCHVHWADGTWFDLEAVRERTREVGALLVIDGTQSVGALPFDIQAIQPDALICAGYKWLMGPYSLGVAYFGEAFDNGNPIEESWFNRYKSEDFAGLVNYEDKYQAGAWRYQVGESSNFALLPMLLASLKNLNEWKPQNIQAYCKEITMRPIAALRDMGCWVEDVDFRASHLFGVRLPEGVSMEALKQRFAEEKIYVSLRGDAVRVSPSIYNEEKDLWHLVEVLKEFV
ncbi:MAG: aminotransferase class V-fold PLP-dependent enzyme [Chitinophagales bacterium]